MDSQTEFANVAFEILDKNAILKILEKLDPKTVLSLCRINDRFSEVCRDQNIFISLMKKHYPQFPINDDAKAQYKAIAFGKIIVYYFYPKDGIQILEAHTDENKRIRFSKSFKILGTKLPLGTELWILDLAGKYYNTNTVFYSKEDAINEIFKDSVEENRNETLAQLEKYGNADIRKHILYDYVSSYKLYHVKIVD